jgi:hypothetical protein
MSQLTLADLTMQSETPTPTLFQSEGFNRVKVLISGKKYAQPAAEAVEIFIDVTAK